MVHRLKCVNPYFEDVLSGKKQFEVRKNDRRFKVGDLLILWEYDPEKDEMLDRHMIVEITYLFKGGIEYGLKRGWVILGIRDFKNLKEEIFRSEKHSYQGKA